MLYHAPLEVEKNDKKKEHPWRDANIKKIQIQDKTGLGCLLAWDWTLIFSEKKTALIRYPDSVNWSQPQQNSCDKSFYDKFIFL